MDARISSWCYRGIHALGDATDMLVPVFRANEHGLADVLVRQLCIMAHLSSERNRRPNFFSRKSSTRAMR